MSNPDISQAAPFSAEAEAGVLGAVLLNPGVYVSIAAFLETDDFFLLRHQYIWEAFGALQTRGDVIDYLTVVESLRAAGHLEEIGGPAYVTHLVQSTPSSVHAEVYGQLVGRASTRRKLLIASDEIRRMALDEEIPIDRMLNKARGELMHVIWRGDEEHGATLNEVISGLYDEFAQAQASSSRVMGISTGLNDLDLQIDGLQPSRFYVVGARPGMGKSALLMKFVLAAARAGKRVAFFLTEMNKREVGWRVFAAESQLNSRRIRNSASLTPAQAQRFVDAMNRLGTSGVGQRIWMDDKAASSVSYILGKAAVARQILGGLDLIVIDGLYLMGNDTSPGNRNEAVTEISQGLKNIARAFDVPLVASHQLNRECERRTDKRPILSDLRDSGSVEQDADVICFIYRDIMYNELTEFPNQAELIIAKNRDGEAGIVSAYFEPTTTSFMNGIVRRIDLSGLDDLTGPRPPLRNVAAPGEASTFTSKSVKEA